VNWLQHAGLSDEVKCGAMESESDEEQLVRAARRGDQHAWDVLLRSLYPRLRAFAANRIPTPFVEDVVSETMTRAVAGVHRFRAGPSGFEGWVFGIARNVVVDHYRGSARERHHAVNRSAGDPAVVEQPGDAMVLGEEQARVRRCFARLSASERELLELRVIAGLSSEQVAAVLGKRSGAVRSAQSRALSRLRQLMEQDDV
jgi:RNA polymerase sigma-70 factor (ECF subfamily)